MQLGLLYLVRLAASAAASYLTGLVSTTLNLRSAAVHSYATAFLRSSLIFAIAAVIARLYWPQAILSSLHLVPQALRRQRIDHDSPILKSNCCSKAAE